MGDRASDADGHGRFYLLKSHRPVLVCGSARLRTAIFKRLDATPKDESSTATTRGLVRFGKARSTSTLLRSPTLFRLSGKRCTTNVSRHVPATALIRQPDTEKPRVRDAFDG